MPSTGPALAPARVVVSDRAVVADDAMRLTHAAYVERGFLTPAPSGRRFIPSYLNPGTRFVVLYSADEPIATATLVPDGPFGLPADRAFAEELDQVRAESDTRCEVSGLSIAPLWQRQSRRVLGLLLGTVVRLNGRRTTGHRAVYVMEPRQAAVVSELLLAERSYGPRPLLGAPGTLVVTMDMSDCRRFFADTAAPPARRLVGRYVLDPNPAWLVDEPPSGEWRRVLLPYLMEASALRARLEEQLELARGTHAGTAAPAMVG